ncbi:MAG: hypothetical protein H7301_03695 [Cryobacterium sp.]|nr:hypothetical protein [Oligoflexia bacterium]
MNASKMNLSLVSAPLLLLVATAANAGQLLECRFANQQGTARIEALRVEHHPELLLLKISLEARIARGTANLAGLLAATINPAGALLASGMLYNTGSGTPINPESITLTGNSLRNGGLSLNLIDSDNVLQHGFGVAMTCK